MMLDIECGAYCGQHFLLSSAAKTLSLSAVARMTDDEARATFQRLRWSGNGGEPYCPQCGCFKPYKVASRHVWKCSELRAPILGYQRDNICRPQAPASRPSFSHRHFHEWSQGPFGAPIEPRPLLHVQERLRTRPQIAGSNRGQSTSN